MQRMSFPAYGSPGADDRRPEPLGQPFGPPAGQPFGPPTDQPPLPAQELPPRPPAPGGRVGRAYGVQVRQESQYSSNNANLSLTVLEFRLAEPGNPQPLDVLMRGRSLSGTVRDGDWVEVAGTPDATNRWNVAKVANLTTGSTVVVLGGRPNRAVQVVLLVFLGVVLLLGVLFFVGVLASLSGA